MNTRLDAPLPRVEADLESSEPSASLLTRHAARIATYLRESALPTRSFTGRMTGYHMGWLDRDGQPSRCSPGKFVRPALCLWSAEACGGDIETALPVAAGIELIHNFTLIHDDIQDQDRTRRNRDTVWALWGPAQGINAGDALHALAFRTLAGGTLEPSRCLLAVRAIADAVLVVVEGQSLDLRLEGDPQTSVRTYLRMIGAKTAALLGASIQAGALVAGAPSTTVDALRRAGYLLGLAFQIHDDWLGTWGDPDATGKSSTGDLGRCKLTYPIVAGYARMQPAQQQQLRALFRDGAGDAAAVRALLETAGGPQLTKDAPSHFARKAVALVKALGLIRRSADDFTEVADYVTRRSR
ncbi:MAG: polyprenyl synthetase family protein [Candidatus Eremiobacteraeota bacterium]|nr:polyprenyl synthetase family protein [Candidatus Eremiobacteraeota bacterium]